MVEQARGISGCRGAANRRKSAFLAMMSHEIRTPLNAVLGLAKDFASTPTWSEQRRLRAGDPQCGDKPARNPQRHPGFLKTRIRALSLGADRVSRRKRWVHNTLSIIGPRASAKDMTVRNIGDASLPPALIGDAGRIRQVLLNLVSNAVNSLLRRDRRLGCDASRVTIGSDGRVGRTRYRKWELRRTSSVRFSSISFQADNSISRRFGGSGLGLAICKRLVEQMGGQIKVTSTLGQGSTFSFRLALPVAENVACRNRTTRAPMTP